jgi:iron complex outermembrane receptor protein
MPPNRRRPWSLRAREAALVGLAGALLVAATNAWGQVAATPELSLTSEAPAPATPDDELIRLAGLSLEELLALPVTSVQGTAHEWFRTPSAVYVITAEDIRRSGHRTLAEALRLAPGMFVGQVDANTWRIGPRGFSGAAITATKNLVLIDGRVVYDPLFSGTFWEAQDLVLEDVDRIEVIRGPGATLWGANAVNGVINVITKSARDTQGLFLSGALGDPHRAFSEVRYGGEIDDDTWFRVWGKFDQWDSYDLRTGPDNHDDWSTGRFGFRIDGLRDEGISWMFQGQAYESFTYGESLRLPVPGQQLVYDNYVGDGRIAGGHLLFRLRQDLDADTGWSMTTYYDHTDRVQAKSLRVERDTGEIDFRHWFDWGQSQDFIWGLRLFGTTDQVQDGPSILLDPDSEQFGLVSGFAQNTSELVNDTLYLMYGTKLDYNSYTGVEWQPSARLWWTPSDRQTIWGAISRAVRVPSRIERDGTFVLAYADEGIINGGPPTGTIVPAGVTGSRRLDSEELLAYELGHRIKLSDDLTLSTTFFYHNFHKLISVPPVTIGTFNNDGDGESYGVENWLNWQIAESWRVQGGYTFTNVQQSGDVAQFEEGNTPHHQAQLLSFLDITRNLEFNAGLYYVDDLDTNDIPAYLRLDLGATWRVNERVELAVWGQNLLDPEHPEGSAVEVPRGFFVQATFRY